MNNRRDCISEDVNPRKQLANADYRRSTTCGSTGEWNAQRWLILTSRYIHAQTPVYVVCFFLYWESILGSSTVHHNPVRPVVSRI